ncbi:MAG: holo-ACP synthase [Epsilonproteobacteria bacterium]|nr:holo-ACP synthase [Campylobacterota bacterium]
MLGVDLVKISRIAQMMERFGKKALQRFLHPEEIELVKNEQTAAGFWATKEAVAKALGCGIGSECSFFDIKIYKTPKGAPKLSFSQKLVQKFNIEDASLSITHDGEYAIGVVALQSTTTDKIEQF